jgi:hypothetical protein
MQTRPVPYTVGGELPESPSASIDPSSTALRSTMMVCPLSLFPLLDEYLLRSSSAGTGKTCNPNRRKGGRRREDRVGIVAR